MCVLDSSLLRCLKEQQAKVQNSQKYKTHSHRQPNSRRDFHKYIKVARILTFSRGLKHDRTNQCYLRKRGRSYSQGSAVTRTGSCCWFVTVPVSVWMLHCEQCAWACVCVCVCQLGCCSDQFDQSWTTFPQRLKSKELKTQKAFFTTDWLHPVLQLTRER